LLLLSIAMLFAGPLLFAWLSSSHAVAQTLDRVIVVVLVGMVVLLLIPEVIAPLGSWAVLLLAVGYFLPGFLEKLVRRAAESMHLLSLYVALVGLLLHAVLDGAGLAGGELRHDTHLPLAIILHRFGVGLMLWMIIEPAFGRRRAWATLFGMAAATIIGFEFSELLLPLAGDAFVLAVQAVIIGTIIHSLVHRGHVHRH
jgi:hypothetical protein